LISRNYEVLVIDPSPGALIAAALLARAGLSVLVLDDHRGHPAVGGFRFLRHRPPIAGFGGGMLLTRTLKALKFHPHELQAVRRTEPGLQVISSRHRLDISTSPEGLGAELAREFPKDARELQRIMSIALASGQSFADALDIATEEAGQTGFLHSVGLARPGWNPPLPPADVPTWGEFLAGSSLSDDAQIMLRALMRPFCALDVVEDLPLPVAGIHLCAVLDGVYSDPGEEDALLSLLLRRVKAMRVDVLPEKLEALVGSRRKIDAALFEGKTEEMPLEHVITGGDPEDLLPWLPGSRRAYERVLNKLAPSHFRYSIHLGVAEDVVPIDLAEHAVVVDDGPHAVDEPGGCMLVSTTPKGSPLAPDGFRSMTVSTLVPYDDDGSLPNDLDSVASRMLDRMKWLIPWLERHLEVLQVPTTDVASDETPIPVDPRPVAYTPAIPPADDPVAAGVGVVLPHRNVYCAGPAAFPALGLGGESLAGRLVERLSLAGAKRPA
jgi:phytoene dehydrogenase-like protein